MVLVKPRMRIINLKRWFTRMEESPDFVLQRLEDTVKIWAEAAGKSEFRIITKPKKEKLHIWVVAFATSNDEIMKDWLYLTTLMANECPKELTYGEGKSRWINNKIIEIVSKSKRKSDMSVGGDNEDDDEEEILAATPIGPGFLVEENDDHNSISEENYDEQISGPSSPVQKMQSPRKEPNSSEKKHAHLPVKTYIISAFLAGLVSMNDFNDTSVIIKGILLTLTILLLHYLYPDEKISLVTTKSQKQEKMSQNDKESSKSNPGSPVAELKTNISTTKGNNKLLQSKFEHAVDFVAHGLQEKNLKINPDDMIKLQALFKQTRGPAHWPRPILPTARKRWLEHKKLKNMSSDDAREAYVTLLETAIPKWDNEGDQYKPQKRLSTRDLNLLATQSQNETTSMSPITLAKNPVQAYSGNWICDVKRSESLDNHMVALGVPWAARIAIKQFVPKKTILVEGVTWTEDSSTGGLSARTIIKLDGSETESIHPANKSIVKTVTTIEDTNRVVSNLYYELWSHKQYVDRQLENNGDVYHIFNQLTLKDGTVYTCHIYYNRV